MRCTLRGRAALGVLLLVVGGYVTADVHDRVPGFLTLAPSPTAGMPAPTAAQRTSPSVAVPSAQVSAAAPLVVATGTAPLPTRAGLSAALAAALADRALGSSVGLTVRDGSTGASLLDISAQVPRAPASTAKLLTASAIMSALAPTRTFSTRVVRGASQAGRATDVILVAGGDTLLSPGRGNPVAVAGRAGLADLAGQVAKTLKAQGVTRIRLRIDDRYASGARYGPRWSQADVRAGLTGSVAMLGLSTQRAGSGKAASTDPALSTATAFRRALGADGITVASAIDRAASSGAAPELGAVHSAPAADLMALALSDSDNALTESLARQAAVQAGRPASFAAAAAWVKQSVAVSGVAVDDVTLIDTCGLSAGTLVPVRVLGDLLAQATGGKHPALQEVVARLPVAGLTGTLAGRFGKGRSHSAAGLARAKTGTLTGVAALAGTVVDKDGRLLTFAILADKVPRGMGTPAARTALDRFVATLAACGCG